MSGPREFRQKYYGRLPSLDEWREYLQMKLEEAIEGFDSAGDFDFALGRHQDYIKSWPQIFDEHGGI